MLVNFFYSFCFNSGVRNINLKTNNNLFNCFQAYTFFFYKNPVYKNYEVQILEILRII